VKETKLSVSDLMYNEVPVIGNEYSKGDWQKIAVHDGHVIKGFFGDYRFLSNFFYTTVYYEGLSFTSSEAAYQSSKLLPHCRSQFQNISPAASKKLWKSFGEDSLYDSFPEEWDERKYDVMAGIVFDKFLRNKSLRQRLLDTGDRYLEETLWWRDVFWGVDIKLGGQNNLGKILMNVREFWKNKPVG
jgi:ribA/ribD-fused uncharacterized protein